MGGFTSGNRTSRDRKTTVEESLELGIGGLKECIYHGASDVVTWNRGRRKASIRYLVDLSSSPNITLYYQIRGSEMIRLGIHLESTPLHFGGHRWWFICPMVQEIADCKRRSSKLYLPPGGNYFACRECHDLTYRSSQKAHETERLFAKLKSTQEWLASPKSGET